MICPFCAQEIQELWQPFVTISDSQGTALKEHKRGVRTVKKEASRKFAFVNIIPYWATCPKCRELLIKLHKTVAFAGKASVNVDKLPISEECSWLALPLRKTAPAISNLVSPDMARDYREANLILDDSPRMSSVLSRRILADLLENYAKIKGYTLAKQIDKFIDDTHHPARHRQNLHYLRELGDFSAHTKTDGKGAVIDVTPEEAEWTLKVVKELFDYFIVDPETDKVIRTRIDEKLKAANRKPIRQLPEAPNEATRQDAAANRSADSHAEP